MFDIRCRCGEVLSLPGGFLGQDAACPACRATLRPVGPSVDDSGPVFAGRLEVVSGPQQVGTQLILCGTQPIDIGRVAGRHILLPGTKVSRAHARLIPAADGWILEDTRSANGVWANGLPVTQHALRNDDRITIGEYELCYFGANAAVDAPGQQQPAPASVAESWGLPHAPVGAQAVAPAPVVRESPAMALDLDESYDAYDVIERVEQIQPPPVAQPAVPFGGRGRTCPSCGKIYGPVDKICVACGIDLKTGRRILTTGGIDESTLQVNAETIIRTISWVLPFGLSPIASEAYGARKPYAVWGLAALTCVISIWVLVNNWTGGSENDIKDYLLWSSPSASNRPAKDAPVTIEIDERGRVVTNDPAAYGEFHGYQLITHAFLHADLLHLAGNMVFLLVFGTRVNSLIGNTIAVPVYLLLAIAAAWSQLTYVGGGWPPQAMLGASGAIMGLAGMYFVLFPAHRVHMAIWLRMGWATGFRLA